MRFSILLLLTFIISSCSESSNIDLPANYLFAKIEEVSTKAYVYDGNNYLQTTIEAVGVPNMSGMSGNIETLELIDETSLRFDEGFGEIIVDYSTVEESIKFFANGSSYHMKIIDDGLQLSSQRVGGGSFNVLNPFPTVSASCEDTSCSSEDPEDWIFASQEGDVGYVIVYEEIYNKQ